MQFFYSTIQHVVLSLSYKHKTITVIIAFMNGFFQVVLCPKVRCIQHILSSQYG